jgi:hypothetical protein
MLGWISSRIGMRRIMRPTLLHLRRRCTSVVLPHCSPFVEIQQTPSHRRGDYSSLLILMFNLQ